MSRLCRRMCFHLSIWAFTASDRQHLTWEKHLFFLILAFPSPFCDATLQNWQPVRVLIVNTDLWTERTRWRIPRAAVPALLWQHCLRVKHRWSRLIIAKRKYFYCCWRALAPNITWKGTAAKPTPLIIKTLFHQRLTWSGSCQRKSPFNSGSH